MTSAKTMCGLTAFNVVGRVANIVRLIIALGLLASAVISFLIASGILASVLPIVMYISSGVQVLAIVTVLFDLSTAKWLVEKVLTQLSQDVYKLNTAIDNLTDNLQKMEQVNMDLEVNLKRADVQIHERDLQIRRSELQLDQFTLELVDMKTLKTHLQSVVEKQQAQIENNALVSANMQQLLSSMLSAQAAGEDMNAHFSLQVGRLERAIAMLQATSFDMIDENDDGIITKEEFNKVVG